MKEKIVKYKKIYITIIISILIQIFIPTKIWAEEDKVVSMESNKDKVKAGETVNVSIYVKDMKINYFSAYLSYDTNQFETINKKDIVLNEKLQEDEDYGFWAKTFNTTNNKLTISENSGASYMIPDEGLLATINLVAKEDCNLSSIKLERIALVDEKFNDINYSEVTLKTIEKNKFTISYNSNVDDKILETTEVEEGEKIEIKLVPKREGYTFIEWNTESNGDGDSYLPGNEYSIETNLTLYAQWKENTSEEPTDPSEPSQPSEPTNPEKPDESEKLYINSDTYEVGEVYISNISEKTKVSDFIKEINTNGKIRILNQEEKELSQEDYVGTGMILDITKDKENIQLQIVVTGDLDGNGEITITDLSTVNKVILEIKEIEGAYLKAADMDNNNKITITDLSMINKLLVE